MKRVILIILGILICGSFLTAQEEVTQSTEMGSINWTTGVAMAKGMGAPPQGNFPLARKRLEAIRVAKLDAMRNLTELIYGIQLTSESTVENYALTSDVIRTRIKGFLRGVEFSDPIYLDDGSVEIEAFMDIKGEFANIVMPDEGFSSQPAPVPEYSEPATVAPTPAPSSAYREYTGLLVDARNISVRPAMVPKIYDEDGNVIYGPSDISRDYAVKVGVVGYSKDPNQAKTNQRISPYPLTVSALRTHGSKNTDVVVSNEDARRIRAANANGNFLSKCKVMFVLK